MHIAMLHVAHASRCILTSASLSIARLVDCATGVLCNNIIPQWLRVVVLVALLLVVVYKTAKKGLRCVLLCIK